MTTPAPAPFGTPGYTPPEPDTSSPAYRAQAAQVIGQVVTDPGTDAGDTVQQITENPIPAALSDYEAKLNAMMRAADEQAAAYEKQFDQMRRQLQTVQAQAGPPTATLLATSLATRVQTIANSNPDLGRAHFAGVIGQAQNLADEVGDTAAGKSNGDRAEQIANGIVKWFTSSHPRLSGKYLEGAGEVVNEAERILEELPNLAPAALAIASAV
jgi:hypothetical protein